MLCGVMADVQGFINDYRAAFEAFDAVAIADRFFYPCQITGAELQVIVTTVPNRDLWVAQIARLLDAYSAIGVRSADPLTVETAELTTRLAQAAVHWGLLDDEGEAIYEFDASYTLADFAQGMRITAIAHNETSRLRSALNRVT